MWAKVLGGTGREWDHISYLSRVTGRELDGEAIKRARLERKLALMDGEAVLPGVIDLLAEGERLGMARAIVSSSSRSWVEGLMEQRGLRERFDPILCADDVARVKPSPDLYVAALEMLGVTEDEALAFEDSPNGVSAARAAGIRCVAVPNRASRLLPIPEAEVLLDSLADHGLAELLAKIGTCPAARPSRS